MSTKLRSKNVLDEHVLDKNNYLMTLLEEAFKQQLITNQQVTYIKMQLIKLLDQEVARYTRYESSSVRIEKAEELMGSMLYVIDEKLLDIKSVEESLKLLSTKSIEDIFVEGLSLVKERLNRASKWYEKVVATKLPTKHIAYRDTIESFKDFFPFYEPEFSAQNITHVSIDYPLAYDPMNEEGVRYVEGYLYKLYLENVFCQHFSDDEIEDLLENSCEDAKEQLINIFELVLFEAIGGRLLGKTRINLTESDCHYLFEMIQQVDDLSNQIDLAVEALFADLDLGEELRSYCLLSSNQLKLYLSKIKNETKSEISLKQYFVPIKPKDENIFYLDTQRGMSDEAFKTMINYLLISSPKEQLEILRTRCESVRDLIDCFEADCLQLEVYSVYYQTLSQMELGMLLGYLQIKNHKRLQEVIEAKAFYHIWEEELLTYVMRLEENQKLFEIASHIIMK